MKLGYKFWKSFPGKFFRKLNFKIKTDKKQKIGKINLNKNILFLKICYDRYIVYGKNMEKIKNILFLQKKI